MGFCCNFARNIEIVDSFEVIDSPISSKLGLIMNIVISFVAIIAIVFGMISMLTPIPGGTILIAGGLTALICSSPSARYCLMWLRAKFSWFNKIFFWLEDKVGSRIALIGTALNKTRPPQGSKTSLSHRDFVNNELDKHRP